ncbi:acetylornithine transaminase [Pseudogracilibacillus auburnensis]|uniref:Acetylornithine aminotransferase n=1 Tax=Pseudogracilibacillus auburnensis TaxID=1494959 RepID=A0A2V3W4K8_9BACI|nr:acetylornithine transaminase [Pseudogracilibacillus auburnensis]PXW88018.1 acetylornithine aminotransferase [Pseudogracilibacillus auburnensis]
MALFPTYNRFDLSVKTASGTIVEDVSGKKYIDFGTGIGVCNLGHRHPEVQKAIEEQLNKYWHVSNLYKNPIQEDVAKVITENSACDNVFFCNSGAEANEAAIKLARKVTGKDKIITFNQSFHGRTFATMAATGQEKVKTGFGPMLESFTYATFNDIESVKKAIDGKTAAIMLEVVQGEGGVIPANEDFIVDVQQLCKDQNILLIVDEIQTGIGRTGKKFGFEHYGLEPDIFTLAKGLGNGLPVGAMVAKKEYAADFGPGTHGSTFGGNPLAMAAAKAVLRVVFNDSFLQEIAIKADYLRSKLESEIKPLPTVKEIRQKGLMVGIECQENAGSYVPLLMEKGVLVLNAGQNVIRLLPPLTTTTEEMDQVISLIKETLEEVK